MAVRHFLAAAGLAVLTAGCASQAEVDQLRTDLNALKAEVSQVRATADRAAADAAAAKACCDRMFGRGLRK